MLYEVITDTSRVTDMSAMFLAAFAFDQNISGWNVSAAGNNHVSFDRITSYNVCYTKLLRRKAGADDHEKPAGKTPEKT